MASLRTGIRIIIRTLFIAVLLVTTIVINILLFMGITWGYYETIFNQPELTFLSYRTRATLIEISNFVSGLLLFLSSILLIVKLFLDEKISIHAIVITLCLFGLFLYSNSLLSRKHEYFRNGYHYLEQSWSDDKNKQVKYKRWKSSKKGMMQSRDIHWVLDSVYAKPWKDFRLR